MAVTAAVTLSPSTIKQGQRSTAVVTVTNTGDADVTVKSVAGFAPPGSDLLIGSCLIWGSKGTVASGGGTASFAIDVTSLAPKFATAQFTASVGALVSLDDDTSIAVTSATLTCTPIATPGTAPYITSQPASVSAAAGATAAFSVTAAGDSPLSYQWFVNTPGTPPQKIAGATSSSYTTGVLSRSSTGLRFSVVVTNTAGMVTSDLAVLTVTA